MKIDKVELTCDLCGNKAMFTGTSHTPWASISIECRHVDRMWYEKNICPPCLKLIKAAMDKETAFNRKD